MTTGADTMPDTVSDNARDTANVIAPPPLIFAIPLIAGLVANWLRPLPVSETGQLLWIGIPIVTLGFFLAAAAMFNFKRAKTAIVPYSPTTSIVSSGPFRFTRNPMYVSFILIYTGLSLAANTLWPFFLLPLAVVVLRRGVIDREEKYLERKFGSSYTDYKSRVRRWI